MFFGFNNLNAEFEKESVGFVRKLCKTCAGLFFLTAIFLMVAQAQETDDVIRVETDLIAFEVTVTDTQGKPLRGLSKQDFKLFEDGIEQEIAFFQPVVKENAGRPLSIVFALDMSGSMTAEEIVQLQNSLRQFVKRLADYNSYFAVLTFGMEVKTLQSFTNKPEKLEKTFNKLARDRDGLSTHAYDAVDEAVRLLAKKSPAVIKNKLPKRAVILVTDGFPVGDTVSPKTVIERANEAETTVYSVLLPSFSRLQGNKKPLPTLLEASGLIEKTGGKTFYVNQNNFEELFKSLAEEITSSYVLAFYPNRNGGSNGKFREVRVETSKNYRIKQNRNGYLLKD